MSKPKKMKASEIKEGKEVLVIEGQFQWLGLILKKIPNTRTKYEVKNIQPDEDNGWIQKKGGGMYRELIDHSGFRGEISIISNKQIYHPL